VSLPASFFGLAPFGMGAVNHTTSPAIRLSIGNGARKGKHRDQRRKDLVASPYINHPIGLANEASVEDERVLIAAVLHDTIEDTETTEQEVSARQTHLLPAP
jgi:(p)ppGpp synthase/HD superfamily hydrolase